LTNRSKRASDRFRVADNRSGTLVIISQNPVWREGFRVNFRVADTGVEGLRFAFHALYRQNIKETLGSYWLQWKHCEGSRTRTLGEYWFVEPGRFSAIAAGERQRLPGIGAPTPAKLLPHR
jgi:hypothetical protein